MTDLEDLADRVLRHACPDPLCKHDSCKTFREAADVIRHEREFKRLQHALEAMRPDAHRIVIDMTSNASPPPTITIPLEDFFGDDVLKTFDKHEELRKDKIRRRDERSKWRR